MTASIERNVYVLRRELPNPIHYVRSTNAISLIFHFRDIEIPSGATAQVYVRKPSSKEVYNTAVISGSDVTVDITTQMFIEAGKNILQVQINQGEENLVTFEQPVIVHENYTEGDAEQSENESTLLQQYVDEVAQAAEDAKNEVQNEVANGKNDLDDYVEALKETIPADYTELSESVEQLERNKAPAIIEEASGTEITLDDSGPAPVKDLQLYGYSKQTQTTGAQLIPFELGKTISSINGNVSLTVEENGFYVKGEKETGDNDVYFLGNTNYQAESGYKEYFSPGEYSCYCQSESCQLIVSAWRQSNAVVLAQVNSSNSPRSFTVEEGDKFRVFIRETSSSVDEVVQAMIYQKGNGAWELYSGGYASPSPDWAQPIHSVGDGGSVTVNSVGANLFRTDNIPTTSASGATIRNNGDGSLTISGTGELTNSLNVMKAMSHDETVRVFKAGTYKLSGATKGVPYLVSQIVSSGKAFKANTFFEANTFSNSTVLFPRWIFDDESITTRQGFYGFAGFEILEQTVYPMLNRGSTPLPWQPYVAPSSALIALTDSLRGIPVTSGGTYTDEEGQQWIADYIYRRQTDGKWMLWRNCGSIVYDGSEDEAWSQSSSVSYRFIINGSTSPALSAAIASSFKVSTKGTTDVGQFVVNDGNNSRYFNSNQNSLEAWKSWLAENPQTVVYQLATPTIEELSDVVQTELNGLMTYNLHTDMWNSDNAHMALKYVADTKSYIDKKIAEISDAIIKRLN